MVPHNLGAAGPIYYKQPPERAAMAAALALKPTFSVNLFQC